MEISRWDITNIKHNLPQRGISNIAVCAVYSPHTRNKYFNYFVPLVLRYPNVTIIQCRYNAIPTATLGIPRWGIPILPCVRCTRRTHGTNIDIIRFVPLGYNKYKT
ncbi:MAG: hypothetical protein LBE13_15200 [Bacteroidales bacterium]|nr:hypothetical protein [Bacteroidales bacterium]